MINEFIEKIIIHAPEKIDGDRVQEVEIYLKFIGRFELPEPKLTPEEIKHGMATFAGPRRRFDFHLKKENIVLIDDYAHHPAELKASILSVKELYAGRKVTGIFQPHLYTRTRDFAADFAASLSLLDELILLDIYPAREEPIPGVTSQIIFDAVTIADKRLIRKEELLDVVAAEAGKFEVVLMVGAGNIELLVDPVKQILDKKE